jgi:hypothetical protein
MSKKDNINTPIDAQTFAKFERCYQLIYNSKVFQKMDTNERSFIKTLIKGHFSWPFLPLCNMHVEVDSRQILTDVVAEWAHQSEERIVGPRRVHLITMIFSDQYLNFNKTELDLGKVKNRVRYALNKMDLNALAFIEFEPTLFSQQLFGKRCMTISCHVHGICWSNNPGFKPQKAAESIVSKRAFKPLLGYPCIDIRARKLQNDDSLRGMTRYIGKFPSGLKKLGIKMSDCDSKPTVNIYSNQDGYTGPVALRMIELYSQLSIDDLIIARGEGSALRSEWKRRLRKETERNTGHTSPDLEQIAGFWRRLRKYKLKTGPILFD